MLLSLTSSLQRGWSKILETWGNFYRILVFYTGVLKLKQQYILSFCHIIFISLSSLLHPRRPFSSISGIFFPKEKPASLSETNGTVWGTYMQKNAYRMAPTNGVIILRQILFECIWISCFYYIHSHPVQSLNGSVYGPVFLVIMHVVEPEKEQ